MWLRFWKLSKNNTNFINNLIKEASPRETECIKVYLDEMVVIEVVIVFTVAFVIGAVVMTVKAISATKAIT